ncbi:hypothetical protein NY536_26670, partial [Enterobacter hormaechei]|nr:hypothetical protein [Enterobacter hormaechei]
MLQTQPLRISFAMSGRPISQLSGDFTESPTAAHEVCSLDRQCGFNFLLKGENAKERRRVIDNYILVQPGYRSPVKAITLHD